MNTEGNPMTFIAMEYYGLILNRTFEVHFCTDSLVGIRVTGVVAAWPQYTELKYKDPRSFAKKRKLAKYHDIDICSEDILKVDHHNFELQFNEIGSVEFIAKRKWGMGPVPHTGFLNINFKIARRQKELILLGNQDGSALARELSGRINV
jgi:hypothetical protein